MDDTNKPISGETLLLFGSNGARLSCTSNENGACKVTLLLQESYEPVIASSQYRLAPVSEFGMGYYSHKEIWLLPRVKDKTLSEVVVKPKEHEDPMIIHLPNDLRTPANYNDPGRIVLQVPGVTPMHDGGNAIVYQGLSPVFHRWSLEGLEIGNPNHLSNAGTFSDRPTFGAGGINALNSRLLRSISLLSGSDNYTQGLGVAINQNLRNGNSSHHRLSGQVGLIGMELTAEGPIAKEQLSYLVSYRYSTVGLLSRLGVSFGDEDIRFQDLTAKLSWQTKGLGRFSAYFLGGKSNNDFENGQKLDDSEWTSYKDRQDIYFAEKLYVAGVRWQFAFTDRFSLDFGANESYNNSRKSSTLYDELKNPIMNTGFGFTDVINTGRANFKYQFNERQSARAYFQLQRRGNYALISEYALQFEGDFLRFFEKVVWMSGIDFKREITDKSLGYHLGLNLSTTTSSQTVARNEGKLFPGAFGALHVPVAKNVTWSTDLRYANQWINTVNDPISSFFENSLSPIHGLNLQSNLKWLFPSHYSSIVGGLFYHRFSALPFLTEYNNFFNDGNEVIPNSGASVGFGNAYGAQATINYRIKKMALNWNTSIFNSQTRLSESNNWQKGRYAMNQAQYLSLEYPLIQRQKKQMGIVLQAMYRGGLREQAIDVSESELYGETIPQFSSRFSVQNKSFFRTDLRFFYTKEQKFIRHTFALDIQNVSNRANDAFNYYDPFLNQIQTAYQLTLIPLLSWRWEMI